MSGAQKALFPCILLAILALVSLTSLISGTGTAEAFSIANDSNAATTKISEITNQPQTMESSTGCAFSDSYPDSIQRWCIIVETQAQKYNLDPNLIAAVMLEESGGNPSAYSPSGAVGLMQVMPSDGLAADFTCNGNPCFASRPTTAELMDPEFNISYGVRMLAGLVQKYGNLRDALKAYGPMNYGYRYADLVLQIYQSYK
jgi:soluble lytic murein transglycosylase-like protein